MLIEATLNVSPIEIIPRTEDINLSSLNDIARYLNDRSGLFMSRLATISRYSDRGWERIGVDAHSRITKTQVDRSPDDLFTGRGLCLVASHGLRDGLQQKVDSEDFTVNIVSVVTDFQSENWENAYQNPMIGGHFLVEITDLKTGEILYADGSYPQVDHRTAGKIKSFPENDLGKVYGTPFGNVFDNMMSEENDEERFDLHKQKLGITDEMYRALVSTIAR